MHIFVSPHVAALIPQNCMQAHARLCARHLVGFEDAMTAVLIADASQNVLQLGSVVVGGSGDPSLSVLPGQDPDAALRAAAPQMLQQVRRSMLCSLI